ncbi:unnamed protein product [Miscanthus lutarioriparius]|uniref:Uncharacterized protein n=1 Tax=Miscanthus lutarioriparius TaxID=422564 RepID=A0A811MYN0_9POAL|nr:unnamed protein product [Miscanthus lutarioriparius]
MGTPAPPIPQGLARVAPRPCARRRRAALLELPPACPASSCSTTSASNSARIGSGKKGEYGLVEGLAAVTRSPPSLCAGFHEIHLLDVKECDALCSLLSAQDTRDSYEQMPVQFPAGCKLNFYGSFLESDPSADIVVNLSPSKPVQDPEVVMDANHDQYLVPNSMCM